MQVVQEREVTLLCNLQPLGVSIDGPQMIDTRDDLMLTAAVLDMDDTSEPMMYSWSCTGESGPCFAGLQVPVLEGNTFVSTADTFTAGVYTLQVSPGHLAADCPWRICVVFKRSAFC